MWAFIDAESLLNQIGGPLKSSIAVCNRTAFLPVRVTLAETII